MYEKAFGAWFRASVDAWSLGVESSTVIGLRLMKLSAGGEAGYREAALMVAEKLQSNLDLFSKAAGGQLGSTPLAATSAVTRHYRRKVSANRRRLTR